MRFLEAHRLSTLSTPRQRPVLAALLCGVLGMAAASPVPACGVGNSPRPKALPPSPPPKCQECTCTASPCFVKQGNFVNAANDLTIRTSGLPLAVSRFYDSARPVDGPAGVGWTFNLPTRLFYAVYTQSTPGTFGREANVSMPDGSRYRFKENPDGLTFSPPSGRYETLVKNTDGSFDLTPQRTRQRYHLSPTGALMSMSDDNGNTLGLTYDGSGRLQRVADASGSGRSVSFYYGADGRVSAVQDSAGRQVQYFYDNSGLLTSVVDAAGRRTSYAYVQAGTGPLLARVSDGFGRALSEISYGPDCHVDNLTSGGQTFKYTFSPTQTQKQPLGTADHWVYTFTDDGLITSRTPVYGVPGSSGPALLTDYTPEGLVQQETDQLGIKTFNTYDVRGNVTSVTRDYQGPQAMRIEYAYDAAFPDKVVSETPVNPSSGAVDPGWQARRYEYFPPGSLSPGSLARVGRVRSDGTVDTMATHVYDAAGRVTTTLNAMGEATDYTYDAAGNPVSVTAPSNNDAGTRSVTTYGYDSLGRMISVTDALGHATTYAYDSLDRVTSVTLPKPSPASASDFTTRYSYDNYDSATGLVFVIATDPNGLITKQGFDCWGHLVQSIDAVGNTTTYTYDQGILTSVRDANGNVTSYAHTSLNHWLSKTTFPDGAFESYAYFNDGQLQTRFTRSGSIAYAYDRLKRLLGKTAESGNTDTYAYTGEKLTSVSRSNFGAPETESFAYDPAGRLMTDTQGPRGTVHFDYRADDSPAGYSVVGGPTAAYGYYPDGSLRAISWSPVPGEFRFEYTLAGQSRRLSFPNGQSRNSTYDDQGRLLEVSNLDPVAGNLATYDYGYDRNYTKGDDSMLGQRVSMTAMVPAQGLNGSVTRYEYDPLYQLARAAYPNVAPFNGEVHSWTYDAIGNRLTNTVNANTQTYTYQRVTGNSNNWQRLLSDGANSYTYDASGDAISQTGPSGTFNFGWLREGRLNRITGSASAIYTYDQQGRRTSKTVAGQTSSYLYDGLNLIQEQGATPADYLFGPDLDQPLAMSRGGRTYYYATDALGSVTAMTNASGAVQNAYLYDAWGQTKTQSAAVTNPFTYTARESGEAGQLFYRARFLSPAIGRFLAEDPIWMEHLLSFLSRPSAYAAVLSSPVFFTDPMGLDVRTCCRPVNWDVPVIREVAAKRNHCYVETNSSGRRRTYGLHGIGGPGWWGTGVFVRDDPTDTGGTCTPWRPDPDCKLDSCLSNAAANYPPAPYSVFSAIFGIGSGRNSNTFVNGITTRCGIYVEPSTRGDSPGWYQPRPTLP
jgi:RHS repeat-associated protein